MKLSKIKSNPNNPRLIKDVKFLKLVKSILTFPEMLTLRPIVLDESNIILGGNMRFKALKHIMPLDISKEIESFELEPERSQFLINYWNEFKVNQDVPFLQAKDLTKEQKKEFIIKDNVSFGENDFDILANEWNESDLQDWGMELPIFDTELLNEKDYETKEPDKKDLSDSLTTEFVLEIRLESEIEQENLYNEMNSKGYKCRILTL
jgi:arsenate reductase-like glutaredoxin family protein